MSTAAVRSSRTARVPSREEAKSGWALWAALAGGLVVVLLLVAWLLGWISFGTDPRVAEVRGLQEEARKQFAESGGPRTVAEATAAVTAMNTIRAKTEALPPHLRSQVEQQGRSVFRTAMRARIDSYFSTPPEKRQAELDRQIDQEEMMRKAFETASAVANAIGMGQTGQAGQAGQGASSQAATQPQGPPSGGPPRSGTEEDRNRWRKSMIDSTTPEQRAKYVEYRRAMDERRQQRGMPSGWGR